MDWSSFFTGLFAFIVIFLLCREIVCWYWKTNMMISLLTEIRDELKKFNGRMGH
jgi:hypothetical protein